ncbi:MAG: signal peptidase I [Paraclostridium sp.]|uniref:signal peptidase I n=1 Tax=Paraclostridium sp. TaxID=2023273 RepID=UPI003F373E75
MEDIKQKSSKILYYIVIVFLALIILNTLTSKSDKLFNIFGYRTYTVLSGSMEPEFYPGDMVVVKHKNKTDIELNDIVTFVDNEGVVVTHRIIEKSSGGYITKGDNNNIDDADILQKNNIIGEVKFHIPKLGYINNFLSDPKIIAIEMIALAIFIFIYYKEA